MIDLKWEYKMPNTVEYIKGSMPLLISMPHNSSLIPDKVSNRFTVKAKGSIDTDWFVDRLYDFSADLGVHIIKPKWSRYYIDLNRDPSGADLYVGADNTELCPTTDFANNDLYLNQSAPTKEEIEQRITDAWHPYHKKLNNVLEQMVKDHGFAVLFDAHSIKSQVPRFFKGKLPDFNFGTASNKSCAASLMSNIESLDYLQWSTISNGRFKGGYITRAYGRPEDNIHAIQLELSQATYMDEETLTWDNKKADLVKLQLKAIIEAILNWRA
jgi:N-formylglutamate deformylase